MKDEETKDEEMSNTNDSQLDVLFTAEEEDRLDREREFQAYIDLKKQNLKENIVEPKLLEKRLQDLQLKQNGKPVEWVESLACLSEKPKILNANDDLSRELSFYTQALDTLQQARPLLDAANVPFNRPDDYFAEMLKSDEHMARVRKRLLGEQERIAGAETRRRQRELKKYGKKVQVEKEQEKEMRKKANLETIKKWRKDRQNEKSLDAALDDVGGKKKGGSFKKGGKSFGEKRDGPGRRGAPKRDNNKSNSSLPVFKAKKFKDPVHSKSRAKPKTSKGGKRK